MSTTEDSPPLVEMPAISTHDRSARANRRRDRRRRMGAKVLQGITLTRHYVTRIVQDVIKPAIQTFLETCQTNPRIAALAATPALLAFLLVLAFLIISTLGLILWTILAIMVGIIFVIIGGLVALVFKLLVVVLVTMPFVAIGTVLLVGANMLSQSIITRTPQNGVTPPIARAVRETDWKSMVEHLVEYLVDIGKNLGPRSVAIWEGSLVLRTALHDAFVVMKVGIRDLHNTGVESLPSDPPSEAETSSEPGQENSNSVHHETESVLEHTEPHATSTEGLTRRAAFPQTSENDA